MEPIVLGICLKFALGFLIVIVARSLFRLLWPLPRFEELAPSHPLPVAKLLPRATLMKLPSTPAPSWPHALTASLLLASGLAAFSFFLSRILGFVNLGLALLAFVMARLLSRSRLEEVVAQIKEQEWQPYEDFLEPGKFYVIGGSGIQEAIRALSRNSLTMALGFDYYLSLSAAGMIVAWVKLLFIYLGPGL